MNKFDSWLEDPYRQQAEADEAIEQEINSLLEDEYDIKKFDVFMDAIESDCLYEEEFQEKIKQALLTGDRLAIGEAIYDAVAAKLDGWAEAEAIDRYNRGFYG